MADKQKLKLAEACQAAAVQLEHEAQQAHPAAQIIPGVPGWLATLLTMTIQTFGPQVINAIQDWLDQQDQPE